MSMQSTIPPAELARVSRALPFWLSLGTIPLAWFCATQGGWTIALVPLFSWILFSILDATMGHETSNADPLASDRDIFWYRLITLLWVPAQFVTLFGLLWYVPQADHLTSTERVLLFCGMGVITGTIGINYSHELMHRKNRLERWLADILLAMVLYSHFRSEHLLVHHRYVGTRRDPVTARYNEGFHRFYPRVLWQCLRSAWRAEGQMLTRKGKAQSDLSNPFWKYAALQGSFVALAAVLGGWSGVALFMIQAGVAIWQLELVNYVEHYGLTRRYLGEGKYEHVKPHHSWNATNRASNWLLINLQRHSDHHCKPDRRFPVLQTYTAEEAPQLPHGYPVMTIIAMIPPLWRRMMNPRVRDWRRTHYPEIEDWEPYNRGTLPLPQ